MELSKIKYVNKSIVFQELPDEVTLYLTISNCPCKCKDCNSKHLWENIGVELTINELDILIGYNSGITAVLFGGGDINPAKINELASYIKSEYDIKVGWFSGKKILDHSINICNFDYIKLGPYIKELGGLRDNTTNQKLYKVIDNVLIEFNINYGTTN